VTDNAKDVDIPSNTSPMDLRAMLTLTEQRKRNHLHDYLLVCDVALNNDVQRPLEQILQAHSFTDTLCDIIHLRPSQRLREGEANIDTITV
jgi:hypothetical protein